MKNIILSVVFVFFCSTGIVSGQKLISGGYKISFKTLEKTSMSTCGKKNTIYVGKIKVKTKNKLKGEYPFYFAEMSKKYYLLAIKNHENKIMSPTIQFDTEENTLTGYKGSDKEITEKQDAGKSMEDIILSGMLMWLRTKQ